MTHSKSSDVNKARLVQGQGHLPQGQGLHPQGQGQCHDNFFIDKAKAKNNFPELIFIDLWHKP